MGNDTSQSPKNEEEYADENWTDHNYPLKDRDMLLASCNGDVDSVKLLIEDGANCNAVGKNNNSALHFALLEGRTDVAKYLIKNTFRGKKIDINKPNNKGQTPLLLACIGLYDMVKLLIQYGADGSAVDEDGNSCLHLALYRSLTEIAKYLIKNRSKCQIDINKSNNTNKHTPFNIACGKGLIEILPLLAENGADCNATDIQGNCPLIHALIEGHFDIVRHLMNNKKKYQIDINKRNTKGQTPLIAACANNTNLQNVILLTENSGKCKAPDNDDGADGKAVDKNGDSCLHAALIKCHTDIAKYLIDNRVKLEININRTNKNNVTPFHIACGKGLIEIVTLLAENGADCNAPDIQGNSPLIHALIGGHFDIVRHLMNNKKKYQIDVNKRNNNGETPLIVACANNGNLQNVILLVENGGKFKALDNNGAGCNVVDKDGDSCLHAALYECHTDIAKYLIDNRVQFEIDINQGNNINLTPLHLACRKGPLEIVTLLAENGASCIVQDCLGNDCLVHALEEGNTDIVRYLIEKREEYPIHINDRNCAGETPIHVCAKKGDLQSLILLIENGGKLEVAKDGNSCLHLALYGVNNTDISKYLIDNRVKFQIDINKKNKNSLTPLHIACHKGLIEIVTLLAENGADCNATDSYGSSVLMHALAEGDTDIVKYLIDNKKKYKIDINKRNKMGQTPLHFACTEKGNLQNLKLLIENDGKTPEVDKEGDSCLHSALLYGCHKDITKYLIENSYNFKIDINQTNNKNQTPLHLACRKGLPRIVRLLAESGANCNATDSNGDSCLMYALMNGSGSTDVVRYLLRRKRKFKIDIDKRNKTGETPLHVACFYKGVLQNVILLMEKGLDCNAVDEDGDTCLHFALYSSHTEVAKYLIDNRIKYKIDINKRNRRDQTPLHVASWEGLLDMVTLLMENGANCNSVDFFGDSCLHRALEFKQTNVVKYFISKKEEYQIDFNKRNKDGQTPLCIACGIEHLESVKLLIESGVVDCNETSINDVTPLHVACQLGFFDAVQMLIEKGANYNAVDNEGVSCLMFALKRGHHDIVKYLLGLKDIICSSYQQQTPLHVVCSTPQGASLEIIELLIKNGVNCNAVDEDGNSCLFLALKHHHVDIVEYFIKNRIKYKIDINRRNKNGQTLLHLACWMGFSDRLSLVKALIENGAQCNIIDVFGNSCIVYALSQWETNVVRYLIDNANEFQIDINQRNKNGDSLLKIALALEQSEMVQLLLDNGACPEACTEENKNNVQRSLGFLKSFSLKKRKE